MFPRKALFLAFAATVSAAGARAQAPAGLDFRVNSWTTNVQQYGRIAMEPDGDFVVVWESRFQDGSEFGVFGQRFAADGVPLGGEFRVNAATTGSQRVPEVAVGPAGDFIVAWHAREPVNYAIRARRFDATGAPIGSDFRVDAVVTGNHSIPAVARGSDGRFVVVWQASYADGHLGGVLGRRFDPGGNALGPPFLVNSYTTGSQGYPRVRFEPGDAFVVVWQSDISLPALSVIAGARFDAAGNRIGGEFQVNTFPFGEHRRPALSVSPSGGFVVVWGRPDPGYSQWAVFARRFDASGAPAGDEFEVSAPTGGNQGQRSESVAHLPDGGFVVSWTRPQGGYDVDVMARRYDATAQPVGGEFRINDQASGNQIQSSIAASADGRLLAVWDDRQRDGSGLGVFARRLGTIVPAALAVDPAATPSSDGNGVLEPGESVVVAPAWRNATALAALAAGTARSFTGPPGIATYTLVDDQASYGTIPEGAAASCASTGDCYAVGLSVPSTRRAHWDATLREELATTSIDPAYDWIVHVGDSFVDVPRTNDFYRDIEALLHRGATVGCRSGDGERFCPDALLTRAQAAVLLLRAKEGPSYVPPACSPPPRFGDVPTGDPFCPWIEELARRGVVAGCRTAPAEFCPHRPITRAEAAAIVLSTAQPIPLPPPCLGPPTFADVPVTHPYCPWVEELARRAEVGCGGGNFCPAARLTRGWSARFIAGVFGLGLYGPAVLSAEARDHAGPPAR